MYKSHILIILLLLLFQSITSKAHSQLNEIDSLEKQISDYELKDTNRVILLFKASSRLLNIDREKSFSYSKEALKISDSLQFELGQANALYLIGDYYYRDDNYIKSIEYFKKSLAIRIKINDQNTAAYCYNNIGNSYVRLGEYTKSVESYKKSLEIFEKLENLGHIAHCLGNIGIVYKLSGDYSEALNYYGKSLRIRENLSDSLGLAMNLNNIGLIYNIIGEYDKAHKYLKESLDINKKINKKIEISRVLSNIASVYESQNILDSSLIFYNKSIDISKEQNYKLLLGEAYNGIGAVFEKKQKLDTALQYYLLGLDICKTINEKTGISFAYNSIGNINLKKNKLEQAKIFFTKAYAIAKEIKNPNNIKLASEKLAYIYEYEHNYKKSLEYYKIFKSMNDSLINEKSIKSLAKFEITKQFETEKREMELEHQKNKAVQAEKDKKKTIIIYALFTSFILMLTIILLTSRSNILKKKLNKQLTVQRDELNNHKNNLEKIVNERTKDLKIAKETAEESVAFKNSILKNISHEIRTPLNGIVGYSHILVSDDVDKNEKLEVNKLINKNSQELIHTIENIVEVSKLESEKYKLSKKAFNVNKAINDEIEHIKYDLSEHVNLNLYENQERINICNDENKLSIVLRNILYNAVKYTEKGLINIRYEIKDLKNIDIPDKEKVNLQNRVLFIEVEDSGIGINSDYNDKIYETFVKDDTDNSKLYRGVGLGLSTSKQLIELMGGVIWHNSNKLGGTTFNILLSIN